MDYTGEHLLPGILGHFFITLSIVASLVATFAYFKTTQSKNESETVSWKTMARGAFFVEILSVFAIFGILFYIIYNHLFEYKYAWQHSSRTLEVKYLLSCFWEGQEGSFLLWSIWHCVLGSDPDSQSKKLGSACDDRCQFCTGLFGNDDRLGFFSSIGAWGQILLCC
jgi:cytochrome c-type biogenesis protein CcmF